MHPPFTRVYANVNYGLLRLIIPYMLDNHIGRFWDNYYDDLPRPLFDYALGVRYVDFVREKVLEPCSISNADVFQPSGVPRTRYYSCPQKWLSSGDYFDPLRVCGATEWKLSAREYCWFIHGLSNGTVFPRHGWSSMVDNSIGLDPGIVVTSHGRYAMHSGHRGGQDSAAIGIETGWLWAESWQVPWKGVIACLVVNCHGLAFHPDNAIRILQEAYEASL